MGGTSFQGSMGLNGESDSSGGFSYRSSMRGMGSIGVGSSGNYFGFWKLITIIGLCCCCFLCCGCLACMRPAHIGGQNKWKDGAWEPNDAVEGEEPAWKTYIAPACDGLCLGWNAGHLPFDQGSDTDSSGGGEE